ncbi:MAG: hypothetical protein JEZ02_15020 [Desulfatibacillum sp.]|nr:hypothetical protein [Desulfatibacillum sp.]
MKTFSRCMLICALACFAMTALSAQAYVLPAEQVLEFMDKALGPAKGLTVTEQVTMYPSRVMGKPGDAESPESGPVQENQEQEITPAPVVLEGTISYKFPESFREEIRNTEGASIVVISPAGVAKVADSYLIAESEDQFDLFKEPLLYRNPQLLMARLRLAGVRTEICSLGYWQGKVAYVVGAQYPDESVPQLWIEKNTFLPIRFIVTRWVPGRSRDSLEVRYEDWQGLLVQEGKKIQHRYPGRIAFVQQGEVLSQRTLVNYAMNPAYPSDTFDVERVKKAYEWAPYLREETPLSREMEGVQDAMEDFRKATQ